MFVLFKKRKKICRDEIDCYHDEYLDMEATLGDVAKNVYFIQDIQVYV